MLSCILGNYTIVHLDLLFGPVLRSSILRNVFFFSPHISQRLIIKGHISAISFYHKTFKVYLLVSTKHRLVNSAFISPQKYSAVMQGRLLQFLMGLVVPQTAGRPDLSTPDLNTHFTGMSYCCY